MRRSCMAALAVAAMATVVVPGVSAANTPDPLRWGACPEDTAAPGLECSTVRVPLSYQDPDGKQIDIAISRMASKNPAQRHGVLLTNPGGPGGAGLQFPTQLLDAGLPQTVQDTYDVIGIDPRGVGHSTPVTCDMTPEQMSRGNIPPYARSSADVVKRGEEAKLVAEQCASSESAWMLPHLSTANAARDMDRIREALGEEKISYHGASYGTHLGAVYSTLFPERTDRISLDSSVPPGGLDSEGGRLIGRGVQDRFPDFAKYAAAHPEHGLGSTPEEITAKYFELAERLDEKPQQGLDGALFRLVTFGHLYRDAQLPMLAELWKAIESNQPQPDPEVPPFQSDNSFASHLYTICNDADWSRSVPSYQADVEVDRIRYPMFGAATANIRPCAFWPSAPVEPPVQVGDRGPSNVLMVQNLRDPATPLAGAEKLRDALGRRARIVTADQGGHGAYLYGANQCANDTVTTFLTTGQRPAQDRACAAESA
ncbi:hydrolase [Amycolatopsis antarctica]|uniref:Hydrolase n=1 Tax=Amycolatopsis antarctica TaxID=1854586 RepID=A0A263CX45_9PSEU|nr:alpha/beta hydrolase [Amycolatopsis antarctica]OZM69997.1 hydrolase [Amycolatopsis antarctica]